MCMAKESFASSAVRGARKGERSRVGGVEEVVVVRPEEAEEAEGTGEVSDMHMTRRG